MKYLRKLSLMTLKILKENNITHWALFGTLLGTIRHSAIIPWDDDVDIGVLKKDISKILALKSVFNRHGLNIYMKNTPTRMLIKVNFLRKPNDLNKNVWLDLFPYYYKESDNNWHRVKGAYTKMPDHDLFPLKDAKFYNYTIPIPNNTEKVLNASYGKDWNRNAVVSLHHKIYNRHHYANDKRYTHKIPIDLKFIRKTMKEKDFL